MNQINTKSPQPLYQILSLDVVLGAVSVGVFATQLLQVKANPYWWIILTVAVWVIYTFDHLVDGFKKKGKSTIYRHRFHYKYRNLFIIILGIAGLLTVILTYILLDNQVLMIGIGLGVIVLFYQSANYFLIKSHSIFFQKELFIAAIYIAGIFLAPLIWYNGLPDYEILLIIFSLSILAFAESVIVSYYDFDEDVKDGLSSFTVFLGPLKTRLFLRVLLGLLALLLIISILLFDPRFIKFLLVLLAMDIILFWIISDKAFFEKNHRFRLVAEAVFFLPATVAII